MSDQPDPELSQFFKTGDDMAAMQASHDRKMLRIAWIIAGVSCVIALCEAAALVALMPLKTVVPYTLLVDRQTGYVQALKPLERELIAPDRALTRSLLAQYVMRREGFDRDSLQEDYRQVALWSAGDARRDYTGLMQAANPQSPLTTLPRRALVKAEIRSISALNPATALVRFATTRNDPGRQIQQAQLWAAVVSYRFSNADMSAADRLINPLGFQVMRYRRDAEMPLDTPPPPQIPSATPQTQPPQTPLRQP